MDKMRMDRRLFKQKEAALLIAWLDRADVNDVFTFLGDEGRPRGDEDLAAFVESLARLKSLVGLWARD